MKRIFANKLTVNLIVLSSFFLTVVFSLNIKNTVNVGLITKEYSDDDITLIYQLKCQNQINPFGNSIVWMYNNSETLPQNMNTTNKLNILITNITEKDTGLYDCCVQDTDSRYICYRQNLRVIRKPPTLAIDMRTNNYIVVQKKANVYMWLFNETYTNINCSLYNQKLPANVLLSINTVPSEIAKEYKDMFINQTTEENQGNYSCIGTSNNKKTNTTFYLKINSCSLKAKESFVISITILSILFINFITYY